MQARILCEFANPVWRIREWSQAGIARYLPGMPIPSKPPRIELVSHVLCPYVQRAVITLTEKNIPHERIYIDLADKPDWFRELSPLGKVPLLRVGPDVLFESTVICEFLDETTAGSLHPGEPLTKARHRAWIEFASNMLGTIASLYNAPDKAHYQDKLDTLHDRLAWLESNLAAAPYFDGARFRLVDAAFGPVFRYFDVIEEFAPLGLVDGLPKTSAWREALARRRSVRDAVTSDYPALLREFVKRRDSHLSTLVPAETVS